MTGTTKAGLPASIESARPARPTRAAKKPVKNSTQATNARKRWAGVEPEARSKSMREIARQRWAADEINFAEAELYFKTADLDEGMETYQEMRKIYEMAGKMMDQRFQEERQQEEKCSNPKCPFEEGGKKFDRNVPWYFRQAKKDPATGRLYNVFACSAGCMVAIGAPGTKALPAPASDARHPSQAGR